MTDNILLDSCTFTGTMARHRAAILQEVQRAEKLCKEADQKIPCRGCPFKQGERCGLMTIKGIVEER